MPNTNSNSYTFIYASVMTLVVAVALAAAATGLKPIQQQAIDFDKKRSIISAVHRIEDKKEILKEYSENVKETVVDAQGNEVQGVKAFDLSMKAENKKNPADRKLPVYIYTGTEGKKYIIPMHGAGLWDEIWGYIAVNDDMNTIAGTYFDHKGETPGLGAEITTPWFQDQFHDKKLAEGDQFKLHILKGRHEEKDKFYEVDGISGSTITSTGVNNMLEKSFSNYKAYFAKLRTAGGNAGSGAATPTTPADSTATSTPQNATGNNGGK